MNENLAEYKHNSSNSAWTLSDYGMDPHSFLLSFFLLFNTSAQSTAFSMKPTNLQKVRLWKANLQTQWLTNSSVSLLYN